MSFDTKIGKENDAVTTQLLAEINKPLTTANEPLWGIQYGILLNNQEFHNISEFNNAIDAEVEARFEEEQKLFSVLNKIKEMFIEPKNMEGHKNEAIEQFQQIFLNQSFTNLAEDNIAAVQKNLDNLRGIPEAVLKTLLDSQITVSKIRLLLAVPGIVGTLIAIAGVAMTCIAMTNVISVPAFMIPITILIAANPVMAVIAVGILLILAITALCYSKEKQFNNDLKLQDIVKVLQDSLHETFTIVQATVALEKAEKAVTEGKATIAAAEAALQKANKALENVELAILAKKSDDIRVKGGAKAEIVETLENLHNAKRDAEARVAAAVTAQEREEAAVGLDELQENDKISRKALKQAEKGQVVKGATEKINILTMDTSKATLFQDKLKERITNKVQGMGRGGA